MDYRAEYNDYWSRADRVGESSADMERIADQLLASCGTGATLDIGSGEGALVAALLRRGVDAKGLDVSDTVVARCNERCPGRFVTGSVLALPFEDRAFDTVVSTDCLEHLEAADVPRALREIRRVTRRNVLLRIATTQDREGHWHLTVEGRAWWEKRCFEAGLRKHPGYYRLNEYESLNHEGWQVFILLEKMPDEALARYPLAALEAERNLHMDMLRDTGERSDAHVVRYSWASSYVKPGDRVLDAACGLGYGGHVLLELTEAASMLGIDGSDYAVEYARLSYARAGGRGEYAAGMLPQALAAHADASFETIVSFETLEHVEDPRAVLREFHRLLAPGGRMIVSVPNDWSDETGQDPNPFHLHVYDWKRLRRELGELFIVEEAFAQTASQCKVRSRGNAWERQPRLLRKVGLGEEAPMDCEWWLMVAMKSPLEAGPAYRERVFANIARSAHPSIDYAGAYRNPWLMHAMVNVTYRLRNEEALEQLADRVLQESPPDSNDHAAALCVKAYRVLGRSFADAVQAGDMIEAMRAMVAQPPPGPMGLRWKVSLLFVEAKLLQATGRLEEARAAFRDCGGHDVRPFGIHLATRTTESWFSAGKIALALGDREGARADWQEGVAYGKVLLGTTPDEILIERAFPNRFNHGDGVREYTVAWDNIARCANGLHLLAQGGPVDDSALENCFQTEYATVHRAVMEARSHLSDHAAEIVATRDLLVERTNRLEQAAEDLRTRTADLVETRATLVERTGRLEAATRDLEERTRELVETRELLVERTRRLEQATAHETRLDGDLRERTGQFNAVSFQLHERTRELEAVNADMLALGRDLAERTRRLEELAARLEEIRRAPFAYALRERVRRIFR